MATIIRQRPGRKSGAFRFSRRRAGPPARLALAAAGIALCALGATQLLAAEPQTSAALQALDYARTQQQSDGGFGGPGITIDAVFAFASAGIDPQTVTQDGKSPADYLATQATSYSTTPFGGAAKLVLALATMDIHPASFGGINALSAMEAYYDPVTGAYDVGAFGQSLYILAEASLARPVPPESIAYLSSLQDAGGGWEFCCAYGVDTNTTALAARALIAGGVSPVDSRVVDALAYLQANQMSDGGLSFCCGYASDPNSTAYAIQALVAAGANIDAGGPWDKGGGNTPLVSLLASQNPATGALQFFGEDSPFATYQGVPGLMLSAYPEQQQSFTPTPTHTATVVATSTTTVSSTATVTATPTVARTTTPIPTSTAIAVAANVATSTSIPSTSTPSGGASSTSSVLGSSAITLPDTGRGQPAGEDAPAYALIVAGAALIAAGAAAKRRAR